jgi:hypothetical protein
MNKMSATHANRGLRTFMLTLKELKVLAILPCLIAC